MPKAFPLEFRRDVVAVARKGEAPIAQIAKDFGISETSQGIPEQPAGGLFRTTTGPALESWGASRGSTPPQVMGRLHPR